MSKKGKLLSESKRVKPVRQARHTSSPGEPAEQMAGSHRIALDLSYYRERYSDLANLDDRSS